MRKQKGDRIMSIYKDKTLLITGGTGSFGNAVLNRFIKSDIKEIRIFSRDEKKQDDMRHALQNPKIKFYIGDVRDRQSVDGVMKGVDYIFSAACAKSKNSLNMKIKYRLYMLIEILKKRTQ